MVHHPVGNVGYIHRSWQPVGIHMYCLQLTLHLLVEFLGGKVQVPHALLEEEDENEIHAGAQTDQNEEG